MATAPQPTLKDIPKLIEQSRNSGAQIDLAGFADVAHLVVPATVGLAMYRAAQEGISNALRHSPGAKIHLDLAHANDKLKLLVQNAAPKTESSAQVMPVKKPGHGLKGINERVAALGGSMQAEKQADGSFVLTVELPVMSSTTLRGA